MSSPMQANPALVGEFQTHFGTPPGTQDAKAECEKWERLCAELLLERERLRAALAREQALHDRTALKLMAAEAPPLLTMEQVYAQIDPETSLEQIIADLKQERGTEK